jgi:uncharacterized membrane protein (TIGR02234 family)
MLLAAGRPWLYALAVQEPVRVYVSVKGSSLSPTVPAVGLVCLAGTVGLLAARAALRRVIGVLIALAGLGAIVATVLQARPGDGDLSARAGAAVGTASAAATEVDHTLWPALAVVGALMCVAAGALTALRGGTWPGMSSRYERPDTVQVQPPAPAADTALDQWRALDRGEDPTL